MGLQCKEVDSDYQVRPYMKDKDTKDTTTRVSGKLNGRWRPDIWGINNSEIKTKSLYKK